MHSADTCLRRMLSDTAEHREAMLRHGALKPAAALLRSDDTNLLLSAIKVVSCFIHWLEHFHLFLSLQYIVLFLLCTHMLALHLLFYQATA